VIESSSAGWEMDKTNKIRRYQRKDYSTVVEFPVEIIGRDGVIRRYSFEESIRLYQRRIASADLRYNDRELIDAEKQHCLHRIQQLRRSFFANFGWPAVQIVDEDGGESGLLAAEVAAFLRRCLSSVYPEPEKFSFSELDRTEHYRVYFVQPPNDESGVDAVVEGHFLLYVFNFETVGGSPEREAFFDLIKVLDGVQLAAPMTVESLIAFFHTHDCGLVLTGFGNVTQHTHEIDLAESSELSWGDEPEVPDPVELGMRMLSHGKFEGALEQFVEAYTRQHFRRVAYLGAAVVADQLGDDDEAETATVMGCRYFPGDSAMSYHFAVNQMRRGSFQGALRSLDVIKDWPQGQGAVELLRALCQLSLKQRKRGRTMLRGALSTGFHDDPHLTRAAKWVNAQLWARNLMVCLAGILGVCSLAGAYVASLAFLALLPVSVLGVRMVDAAWHRQLIRQIVGSSGQRMRLSSSAILSSDTPGTPLQ